MDQACNLLGLSKDILKLSSTKVTKSFRLMQLTTRQIIPQEPMRTLELIRPLLVKWCCLEGVVAGKF